MARVAGYRYENGKSLLINTQTGDYTLTPDDNGGVVVMNKATAVTVTVANTLPIGFHCVIVQKGAGQVTIAASSTTIHNASGQSKTSGQWAEVSLLHYEPDVFILGGSTGA